MLYIKMIRLWIACSIFAGCAINTHNTNSEMSVPAALNYRGSAVVNGWISWAGSPPVEEVEIYGDEIGARGDVLNGCLSGFIVNQNAETINRLKYKLVMIEGNVIDYDTLPVHMVGMLERRFVGDTQIMNWCRSKKVIIIHRITELPSQ